MFCIFSSYIKVTLKFHYFCLWCVQLKWLQCFFCFFLQCEQHKPDPDQMWFETQFSDMNLGHATHITFHKFSQIVYSRFSHISYYVTASMW